MLTQRRYFIPSHNDKILKNRTNIYEKYFLVIPSIHPNGDQQPLNPSVDVQNWNDPNLSERLELFDITRRVVRNNFRA